MKLQQGQIWKQGEDYYRIVEWARLSIEYKLMKDLEGSEAPHHTVTKKEFCKLIKGAELMVESPKETPEPSSDSLGLSEINSPSQKTE